MKKLLIALTLVASLFTVSSLVLAGAEHDHGAPTFQPKKKNGVLKSTENNHFEISKEGDLISLYVYDKSGKDITTQNFKLISEVDMPKKKKKKIDFIDMKSHWEAKFDWQKAHRITIKITVDDGKDKDYVKFTLENN